jgi:hypothetical protein
MTMHAAASSSAPSRPLATLRKLVRDAAAQKSIEHCELCNLPIPAEHQHLIEPAIRRLVCTCDACAVLFDLPVGGRYRRVPRQIRLLSDFTLTDADWDRFLIPINMAFFFANSLEERMVAMYPSPAGATESLVDRDAWQSLVEENSILDKMQSDVEALLVNRLGARYGFASPEYYLAPIDECYKLVGLLRTHWHGFSGGTEVWQQITQFYQQLKQRSVVVSATIGHRVDRGSPEVAPATDSEGAGHA